MNIEEKSLRNLSKESMTHGLIIKPKSRHVNRKMVKSSKRKVKPKSNEKVSKTTNHTINSGGRTKISSLYNRVKIPIRPLNLEHPYKNSFGKKYQNSSVNNSNFN